MGGAACGMAAAAATASAGLVVLVHLLKRVHEWVQEVGLGEERRRRLPPGDMGWPIFGTIFAFLRAFKSCAPDSFVASFIRRFPGARMYKTFMFGSPTIMIATPEACKQVLMDDEHFIPGWPASTCQLMGVKSFVGIVDEEHKRLRRLTSTPINGYDALNTYLRFIDYTVVSTLEGWSVMGEIEFLTELRRFTFRIIMKIFLGTEGDASMQMLERVYTDLNLGVRAMAINLPGFAFHRALKARKTLVDTLQGILNGRREMRVNKNYPVSKDMMDHLIDAEDDNGRRLTDEEIIDVLIMYLNAGHESSGHITMWTTVFLQENPDIFEKARAEQEEIRRSMPPSQKGLTMVEFRKMKYLSKVIDESLRLVNISFVTFREATKDIYMNDYLIPKGWKVQLWFRTIHLDSRVYSNPRKFDPSRWDELTPKPGTFVPFGGGSRLCPGNELAKLEISVFLHYFLLGYKLKRMNPRCPVRFLPHPRPTDNCLAKVIKLSP